MSDPAPFEFLSHRPEAPLSDVVESLWFARGTVPYRQEHIAPTGSCVAIFVFGDPIEQTAVGHDASTVRSRIGLFVGPHDGPLVNRPLGETHAVGIVARPTSSERLFGLRPAGQRGKISQLDRVWPAAKMLYHGLEMETDGAGKLGWLAQKLCRAIGPELKGEAACKRAISKLETNPRTPISRVAEDLGMSVSNFDRTFKRLVGLTPRSLSNLLKMRELLTRLDIRDDIDWAGVAAEFGWYDQSHFVKAFKRHTGHTPTSYVTAQRRYFDEETLSQAAGFVPEV